MIQRLISFLILITGSAYAAGNPTVIVLTGAPGSDKYGRLFAKWAGQWKQAATKGGADFHLIDKPKDDTPKKAAQKLITAQASEAKCPLWIVLIGHGTFDGKKAKFNLQGPDLEAVELAIWLKDSQRPTVIINCTSSSSPFLPALSRKGRVVITATRSGFEQNFSHLGGYLAAAIINLEADFDKDGQTSLLEAWLAAARHTADFYKNENRLATEHTILDDNGDGKGTSSDWYRGLRVTKKSEEPGLLPDGLRAHQFHLIPSKEEQGLTPAQRTERDRLEIEYAQLRAHKETLEGEKYYQQLEQILRKLGRIYFREEKIQE
ncbi:MAG: hypothetical protein QF685_08465 [Verrucomicrobiota bacterium]|jgi:hypothetical protein|nr:hypothetical protein [Verrucomicrobiota bacterium]